MAQFLRGKQAGIQRDFSAGLDPRRFAVDLVRTTLSRCGDLSQTTRNRSSDNHLPFA